MRAFLSFRNRLRRYALWFVQDELQKQSARAREEAASLGQQQALLREEIESLRQQQVLLREEIVNLIKNGAVDSANLGERISKLELILTEHPDVTVTNAGATLFGSPAVSVILPTWNRAGVVGAAIRSVQAQQFADWELIVVDDGSTDDTSTVMAAFEDDPRICYIKLPHAGQCVARNHGLNVAKGSLIAYLDSDNLWYPGFLAAAVPIFANQPEVDCAYGAMITDAHGPRVLFEPFDRERLMAGNFIDMSTFIHRRDLTDRYGGFDDKTSPLEDWDLVLRYTAHAPAYRVPVAAVRYRVTDDKRVSDTQAKGLPTEIIRRKSNLI
jgi:Glycosyl transferase family 2